ncbi:GerMN domain-containing protein [Trichloromonas sp.]|uniref:GerMN domain-containing protein n=1 Tax=Trichloromonas sp. TaxID=3069249 RepID=UPI003D81BC12
MQGPFKSRLLLLAVLVVLLAIGAMVARQYLLAPKMAPELSESMEPTRQLREVLLYFASSEGIGLESEMREIEDCLAEEDCLRATLQALIAGPTGERVAVLSSRVLVQKISVDGATAIVSFSRELVAGHPGGSMSELLTVHALANTLAVNFPHIRQVRILIEGAPVETLKGHVDLRDPIAADFDFGRLPVNKGAARPGGE